VKKLLGIVVLVFLTACTNDSSVKSITNCADHHYSKKNITWTPLDFYELLENKRKPQNKLEEKLVLLQKGGFKYTEILSWLLDLQKKDIPTKKEANEKQINIEDIKLAKKILKDNNKRMKKFISSSLNTKLINTSYEKYFQRCEFDRKDTPKTFDAKWKKSKVVYNKIN
jgi:hypothetical protein